MFQTGSLRVERFMEIFEVLNVQCDQQIMELFVVTVRGIWYRQNKLVFEGSFLQLLC